MKQLRGYCPTHEYDWPCDETCRAARMALREVDHDLGQFWRERARGVRILRSDSPYGWAARGEQAA